MANIQNDIFENQEIAYGFGTYNVTKQGDVKCASLTVNGEPIVPGGGSSFKGIVADESQLPATAENGDIYLVKQTPAEDTTVEIQQNIPLGYNPASRQYYGEAYDIYYYGDFKFKVGDVVNFELIFEAMMDDSYSGKSVEIMIADTNEHIIFADNFVDDVTFVGAGSDTPQSTSVNGSLTINDSDDEINPKFKVLINAETTKAGDPIEPEGTDFMQHIKLTSIKLIIKGEGEDIKKLVMFADGEYLQIA